MVPLIDQAFHLSERGLKVADLNAGIRQFVFLFRQYGIDKNGGAGQLPEYFSGNRSKIAPNINQAAQFLFFKLPDHFSHFFRFVLSVIIIMKTQYKIAGIVDQNGQHIFYMGIERIIDAFRHQADLWNGFSFPARRHLRGVLVFFNDFQHVFPGRFPHVRVIVQHF